jgi:hypothetical protein
MSKRNNIVIDCESSIAKIKPREIIVPEEGGVYMDILMQVRHPNGELVNEHQQYGHSFLSNFIKMLFCTAMVHEAPTGVTNLTDTGGTTRAGLHSSIVTILGSTQWQNCNALANDDDWGILAGTGNTAVDIADYALDTKCAEGTSTDEFNYGTHALVTPVDDDSTYSYAGISRTASNASGATIGVNEVGLVCKTRWEHAVTQRYFMLIRDVLGSTVNVPNGDTLTVSYRCKCFC